MKQAVFYPDLQIVSVKNIKLQEYFTENRAHELSEVLIKDGKLRNPPLVTKIANNNYLHLDGATRLTSLKLLGYPNCLVQVVDYSDTSHVHLTSWSHSTTIKREDLFEKMSKIPQLSLRPVKHFDHRSLLKPEVICILVFENKLVYEVVRKGSLLEQIKDLNHVVTAYVDHFTRVFSSEPWNRTSIGKRFALHPDHNLFVTFPIYSPQQVISITNQGVLFPAGVTRHVVYRRKLNVNLPLSYLTLKNLKNANEGLQKFMQTRNPRLYEEPVIYFE